MTVTSPDESLMSWYSPLFLDCTLLRITYSDDVNINTKYVWMVTSLITLKIETDFYNNCHRDWSCFRIRHRVVYSSKIRNNIYNDNNDKVTSNLRLLNIILVMIDYFFLLLPSTNKRLDGIVPSNARLG